LAVQWSKQPGALETGNVNLEKDEAQIKEAFNNTNDKNSLKVKGTVFTH